MRFRLTITAQPFTYLLAALSLLVGAPAFNTAHGDDDKLAPWADKKLDVKAGLILWLDAGAESRARQALGLPIVADGSACGIWHDGSGREIRVTQRSASAQPKYVAAGDRALFRFDGKDDAFDYSGPQREAAELTAFLVAAPRSNAGLFVALLAGNAQGANDYTTGFTIDQGPGASGRLDALNVEGVGFGGAGNLLRTASSFGRFHTFEVRAAAGPGGVSVTVDGVAQGKRDRQPGRLRLDELTVGARFYSNEAAPPSNRGFFDGDIAEILLYDRTLSDRECKSVRDYLRSKYEGLDAALGQLDQSRGRPLQTVENPPAVQIFVPGFRADELPIQLPNINNLRYRPDGKLLALGYNGNVYLLTDRDGDGLEDHSELFWDNRGRIRAPIGMALTPPNYVHGSGLFVASKGKCSLIVDSNGDDRADKEIIVAEGWKEIQHGVDALGVAYAPDGSVYFGIGSADFTNAYLLDAAGRSHYDLKDERSAILRVARDFRSREVIATGIRFPVALAFNRRGDLFATDQEGATWLPNGNPLDELLHVQRGRHYGFPPRHSKHLPSVIDEPSVFDYAPQHQSTCGLTFNEPVSGGPVFGPDSWRGDAIVCGYSRGKIFRTTLVATPSGYVGKTSTLASLGMLTVDACVAPDGALAVATHSGGPDWGSGPDGQGKLYKLRYKGKELAQPVLAWPESPREVRIAFDRPIAPEHLAGLTKGTTIQSGAFVSPGERFETLRPGYATVQAQVVAPRHDLAVRSVNVSPDRRTLLIGTDPDVRIVPHAITLNGLGRPARDAKNEGIPQEPVVDVAYDLTGIQASWKDASGVTQWTGWLPHFDLEVSRSFSIGSAGHERLWPLVQHAGSLELRGQLNLREMLRPKVQPGSKVDDVLPPEQVTLRFEAGTPFEVVLAAKARPSASHTQGTHHAVVSLDAKAIEDAVSVTVNLPTSESSAPALRLSWSTAESEQQRALPLSRILVPWARGANQKPETPEYTVPPELQGGQWARGRAIFLGELARCSQCHTFRGQGGKLGPDLSNLVHRDYASVLRDIREPSFAINPDFITYSVALADGRVLNGPIRTEGQNLLVGDGQGKVTTVVKDEVEEARPSPESTMPTGLAEQVGPERLKDLLTYLMARDLEPAPIRREGAPPARTLAEVESVLKAIPAAENSASRPMHVLLVDGPKDHGIDEHDYPLWRARWSELLGRAENVAVHTAEVWPSPEEFRWANVIVWYSANPGWAMDKRGPFDEFLARGGGMVFIHYALNGRGAPEALAERIGLAWKDGASRFRHGPLELSFPESARHPITAGFTRLALEDESYWALLGDPRRAEILAIAPEEGHDQPLIWARQHGQGRVVGCIPGHYTWTFDDPLFRILLLRSIAWSAGEPVGRLQDLSTLGARMAEPPKAP